MDKQERIHGWPELAGAPLSRDSQLEVSLRGAPAKVSTRNQVKPMKFVFSFCHQFKVQNNSLCWLLSELESPVGPFMVKVER